MGNNVQAAIRSIVPCAVDMSVEDDGQTRTDLADLRQRLACAIGANLAEAADTLDLSRLQNRKNLVTASFDNRWGCGGHGKRVAS